MAIPGPGALIVSATAGQVVANTVLNAADLLATFGAGAKISLERDTTAAFVAPLVVASPALVAGTERYEIVDTAATGGAWYRVRVGNTGGTLFTDYSPVVQAGGALAYATLDDVREAMNFAADTSRDAYLSDLLLAARSYIDGETDRSFGRNPLTGTGVFTFRVIRPHNRLSIAIGGPRLDIVSLSTLEISTTDSQPYSSIPQGSAGYYLIANEGPEPDWPYGDVELSRWGSQLYFPVGNATVRLTGVLGFNSVPQLVRRASVDLVREWYRQGPQGGVPAGVNQYGTPLFVQGEPHTLRTLKALGSPYTNNAVAWVR